MLTEAETRTQYIDPLIAAAGWGSVENSRVRREVIAPGRILGSGRRGEPQIADYVLEYWNQKLAVVEAKRWDMNYTEGLGQAKVYAQKLGCPFALSTNGQQIYWVDMRAGIESDLALFPTPQELWNASFPEDDPWWDKFARVPMDTKGGTWAVRYYQAISVSRVLYALATGQDRILLTLATGTGKTRIAFQLAWKLFHARWTLQRDGLRRPRILFLADRNVLADQAFNEFSAFAEEALVRVDPADVRKKGRVPTNGSIFFTIFQTFMSSNEGMSNFDAYPSDFFDFIIVDECHRGGANDESTWRAILEYFSPAVQLGLTATPKRKGNVDTYAYFGDPVYSYSLKEGITDGFLTPFRVKQFATTLDDYTYVSDDVVVNGEIEEGRRYTEGDFNSSIIIREREEYRVVLFMDSIDQNEKTLVFCKSQQHALMIRDLVNQNKVSQNTDYCQRVTADDGAIGDQYLRDFQDNEKTIPTILTTSQKLSTGVDARNVRNIVLLRPINSMIEFKQIIGRGTRLYDGKDYFTIYDFVQAHHLFADPAWDGEALDETSQLSDGSSEQSEESDNFEKVDEHKWEPVLIELAPGKSLLIQHMVATTFVGSGGKPLSAAEFIANLFNTLTLPGFLKDETTLRQIWSHPSTRKELMHRLDEAGFHRDDLDVVQRLIQAEKSDLYDVLESVAFAKKPITRADRALVSHGRLEVDLTRDQVEFVDFVLTKYVNEGVDELDIDKLPQLLQLKYRAITDGIAVLGGVEKTRGLFIDFQKYLYLADEAYVGIAS